jgi:NAD(P)-dependent dehydrogenase (short-subunit alcohol dehydrogenase family)
MVTSLRGAVAVVTGAGSGIGAALARRFTRHGARAVVVADLRHDAALAVAADLGAGALGVHLDVGDEAAVGALVERVEAEIGPIDLWCSNAGVAAGADLGDDGDWALSWRVHVLAHLYAARAVLPRMARRGRGHFQVTASAAGLLTELDSAPYTVTKHASVALAEWLAIRYGDSGVGFSCLCPQGVRTPLLAGLGPDSATVALGGLIEPEDVADAVVAGLAEGRFLILPHPQVGEYERRRAADRDRWLAGMRRMRAALGVPRDALGVPRGPADARPG